MIQRANSCCSFKFQMYQVTLLKFDLHHNVLFSGVPEKELHQFIHILQLTCWGQCH